MAVGNKFVLTLKGLYVPASQAINNVFAYRLQTGEASAANLAQAFAIAGETPLMNILNAQTIFDEISVVNLDQLDDFVTYPVDWQGATVDNAMPSFVSWVFQYNRASRAVNNGRKMIGVPGEDAISSGIAQPSIATALAAAEEFLGDTLTIVVPSASFVPCIWRRAGNYGSPPVSEPDQFFDITGVSYKRVSTMNTRKQGRGA